MDRHRGTHHAERAILMSQLLSPPLPMVCRGGGDDEEERITSSHDLIFSILGRLIALPSTVIEGAYPNSGHGGDWRSHLVTGEHAIKLLRSLTSGGQGKDTHYDLFCMYTRELISIAIGYDMFASAGGGRWVDPGIQDIRFLHDTGRVSLSRHPSLVMSAIDFYFSIAISRGGMEDGVADSERDDIMRRRDYRDVLERCMRLISTSAPKLLPSQYHHTE